MSVLGFVPPDRLSVYLRLLNPSPKLTEGKILTSADPKRGRTGPEDKVSDNRIIETYT